MLVSPDGSTAAACGSLPRLRMRPPKIPAQSPLRAQALRAAPGGTRRLASLRPPLPQPRQRRAAPDRRPPASHSGIHGRDGSEEWVEERKADDPGQCCRGELPKATRVSHGVSRRGAGSFVVREVQGTRTHSRPNR